MEFIYENTSFQFNTTYAVLENQLGTPCLNDSQKLMRLMSSFFYCPNTNQTVLRFMTFELTKKLMTEVDLESLYIWLNCYDWLILVSLGI